MLWSRKTRRPSVERPFVEMLEARILYSADAGAGVLPVPAPAAETRTLDANGDYTATAASAATAATTATASAAPLAFELNVGQTSAQYDALARGNGFSVGLAHGDATIVLGSGASQRVLHLTVAGADAAAQATPDTQLQGRSNYIVGNDPSQWHTDVANYDGVTYQNVYQGVDLRYHGSGRQLEYDFRVNPGGNAQAISLRFDGAQSVGLDADGNLVIQLDETGASIRFLAPVSYQEGPNGREAVESRYEIAADGSVHFALGNYDNSRALVIDPILSYGTYLGSGSTDVANAVAVDASGNVYVAGYNNGSLLALGGDDVAVEKYSADLSTLIYSTVYGNLGDERATGIAVDAAGNAYVTGWTKSGGLLPFPTANAFQSTLSGAQDAFLFKLNAAGSAALYSTYLGGSGANEMGNGVAVDASGNAYVVGTTDSANFPVTAGAADTTAGGPEAFVAKFNAGGARVYATFIGGTGPETGNAIAVDSSGQAVVVGSTKSNNLATVNPIQSTISGPSDAFVVRLNAAGSAFNFSTYFGGTQNEVATSVALRADGEILIGGTTNSKDLTVTGTAFQATLQNSNTNVGFIALLNPASATIDYASYIDGSRDSSGGNTTVDVVSVALDSLGRIYATGSTDDGNFTVSSNALKSSYGGNTDAFVVMIDPAIAGANGLLYGSYLGGTGADNALGAAFNATTNTLFVVGSTTSSSGIAVSGGSDTSYNGGTDGFVAGFKGLTGVNHAPVLSGPNANAMGGILEDPATNDGTLVSALISSKVTDVDTGAAQGIAVTAVNNANGTWEFSTDNKATWTAFGSVSGSNARLLAADPNTRVRFVPNANFNGTVGTGITFRAWDQTSGTAGGTADVSTNGGATAFSTATASSSIVVTSVNDAPAGANKTVTALEDAVYTFALADFGFSDTSDNPANAFLNVRITTLPGVGSLTLAGTAVVAGQFVSAASITAGNLKFTPAANANGAGYASFTFQVQDDGGTAGGGVDLDPTARTITVNVTAVNDAPVLSGANNLAAILENDTGNNGTAVSTLVSGKITDVDTGAVQGIAVTAVNNTNGTWQYSVNNGATWTAFGSPSGTNARLLAADANTRVRFVPNANFNGTVTNGITFRAWDATSGAAGGTADVSTNGGTSTFSTATASSSITVTSVNTAPAGASKTVTTQEDTAYIFSVADFGFSDTDSPANNLLNVRITTVPGAGQLTLSGVAVTAGQFVSAADINAGKLMFTPAANANGAGYAAFTFQVQDDGGTANGGVDLDPTARTMTVNVAAVNDPPTLGLPPAQATTSNTAVIFSPGGGNAITVADVDAGAGQLSFTLSAANGTLTLSGTAGLSFSSGTGTGDASMSFTGTLAAINAALDGLRFDPTPAYSGSTSLSLSANDQGNTGSGGAQTATGNVVVNVSFVNSAPTFVGSGNLTMNGILEDATSNGGTLVSTLIAGQVADIDAGAVSGIAVTAVDNTNGAWQYSTDGGSNWLSLTGVSDASARLLAADGSTLVRLVPNANFNGPISGGLTFRAWDQTTGAAGGLADTTTNGGTTAFSAAHAAADIDVTAVNDPPVGTANTVTTLEGAPLTFTTADFGFADPADSPSNALIAVKVSGLPASGSLTLNGVAVTAGQFVSAADIAAGKLVYTAPIDANGAGYDSFNFQVQDDGGTANGGVDLDATARAMTINVTPVNDAPSGSNGSVTRAEDTPYAIQTADFGFSDPQDTPANGLLNVRIASLPAAGQLTLNGAAVTVGQFVSAADIAAGKLVFTSAANANGAGYASFGFQVQDDGGTAGGGVDLDPTARTLTFNVTSVNDAPAGASNTVTTNEDTGYIFGVADFGFSDTSDSPANALLNVRIAALPGTGALTLNGAAVAAGQFVSAADIAAGKLVFTPAANANGAAYGSFTFQVQDDGGTAGGGIDLDPTARSMTVNVNAVNDAPVGADGSFTTLEDTPYTFALADFAFSDPSDTPGDTLLAVKISALPGAGTLTLNGAAVAAGQFVSASDIAAGKLIFTPAANAQGSAYTTFPYQAQDSGGTANGGIDLDPTARTITANVTPVNDPPVSRDATVSATTAQTYTFSTADFGFSDPDDNPQNIFLSIQVQTLPAAGMLALDGVAVTANQNISAIAISQGELTYVASAAGSDAFSFKVRDNGGTANGGVNLEVGSHTLSFVVADPPPAPPSPPVVVTPPLQPTTPTTPVTPPASTDVTNTTSGTNTTTTAEVAPPQPGPALIMSAAAAGNNLNLQLVDIGARGVITRTAEFTVRAPEFITGERRFQSADAPAALADIPIPGVAVRNADSASLDTLSRSMRSAEFAEEMDKLRKSAQDEFSLEKTFALSSTGITFGVSLGVMIWILRSGVLLSSLLSVMPAWRVLDPLPVLSSSDDGKESEDGPDEDDDLLEQETARDPASVLRET